MRAQRFDSARSVTRAALAVVTGLLAGTTLVAPAAAAGRTCVVTSEGCFVTLQGAVAAAPPGSTLRLGRGTLLGGASIDKDLAVVGSGAGSTVIRGGDGSVVTIGLYGAATEPTVSIRGVTITGGAVRSSPESIPGVGQAGVLAEGGGVEIPPNADRTGGATVTITDSVITRNRVAPLHTLPVGPPCPPGPCPYAMAAGGGIDNWGTLTLDRTSVCDNQVGSGSGRWNVASDAEGGGIQNWLGPLIITDSTISGNTAVAAAPDGRFADGGAILVDGGALSMTGSTVDGNSASLAAAWPDTVTTLAIAGGIHVSASATATVRGTAVRANSVRMTNSVGSSQAFSGGLHTDNVFTLTGDVVSGNTVTSRTVGASTGAAEGDSGAGEMGGTASDIVMDGNRVQVSSVRGDAYALGGASIVGGMISGARIAGNTVSSYSPNGHAYAVGGAFVDGAGLTISTSVITSNVDAAWGPAASAQGGGIFDGTAIDGPPSGPLNLIDSAVTGNRLSGSPGTSRRGGGIFATDTVTRTRSIVTMNVPDQCQGC